MKLTKTEAKLLKEAASRSNLTVWVLTCYGRGCRKGGEGHRAFNAYLGLKEKGLIENTDHHSHQDTRRGWTTHVTEFWGKLSPAGIALAATL